MRINHSIEAAPIESEAAYAEIAGRVSEDRLRRRGSTTTSSLALADDN